MTDTEESGAGGYQESLQQARPAPYFDSMGKKNNLGTGGYKPDEPADNHEVHVAQDHYPGPTSFPYRIEDEPKPVATESEEVFRGEIPVSASFLRPVMKGIHFKRHLSVKRHIKKGLSRHPANFFDTPGSRKHL